MILPLRKYPRSFVYSGFCLSATHTLSRPGRIVLEKHSFTNDTGRGFALFVGKMTFQRGGSFARPIPAGECWTVVDAGKVSFHPNDGESLPACLTAVKTEVVARNFAKNYYLACCGKAAYSRNIVEEGDVDE